MCSAVDFGSGDVDHAFDIQDLRFDLADADDKVFLFVPGFGQAVKVVLVDQVAEPEKVNVKDTLIVVPVTPSTVTTCPIGAIPSPPPWF